MNAYIDFDETSAANNRLKMFLGNITTLQLDKQPNCKLVTIDIDSFAQESLLNSDGSYGLEF